MDANYRKQTRLDKVYKYPVGIQVKRLGQHFGAKGRIYPNKGYVLDQAGCFCPWRFVPEDIRSATIPITENEFEPHPQLDEETQKRARARAKDKSQLQLVYGLISQLLEIKHEFYYDVPWSQWREQLGLDCLLRFRMAEARLFELCGKPSIMKAQLPERYRLTQLALQT